MPSNKSHHKLARPPFKNGKYDAKGITKPAPFKKVIFLLLFVIAVLLRIHETHSQTLQHCLYGADYLGSKRLQGISLREFQASKIDTNLSVGAELSLKLDRVSEHQITSSNNTASISAWFYAPQHGFWSTHTQKTPASTQRLSSETLAQLAIATIISQLIEEKQLLPHDSLERWFPDTPYSDLVTIDHLLTHTSGLKVALTSPETPNDHKSLYEFCPGTNVRINSANYSTLAQIIEQLEQETLSNVVKQRIAQTLELSAFTVNNSDQSGVHKIITTPKQATLFLSAFLRSELVSDSMVNDALRHIYPLLIPPNLPETFNNPDDSSQFNPQKRSALEQFQGIGRGIMVGFTGSSSNQPNQNFNPKPIWVGLEETHNNMGKKSNSKYMIVLFDLQRKLYLSVSMNGGHGTSVAEQLLKEFDAYTLLEQQ